MNRATLYRLILVVGIGFIDVSCAAPGRTYYGFTVGVTNAPPPPSVVFVEEPALMRVPGSGVYVVTDAGFAYDMFRYSGFWYVLHDGYWYRSSSYRGSFVVVDARHVPRQIMEVPRSRWKHHPHGGPPGQRKKRGGPPA